MGSWIGQLLFPEHCSVCGRPGSALCGACISQLPPAPRLPAPDIALYHYRTRIVWKAIWELKYYRKSEVARALARAAVPRITALLADHKTIALVPIPGSPKRFRERGYNQSALLALWWCKHIKHARVQHLLYKSRFTLPQARCGKHERLTNVKDSMRCTRALDPHTTYIIIDDVITTGATIAEARRALTERGAQRIIALALAHGYKR